MLGVFMTELMKGATVLKTVAYATAHQVDTTNRSLMVLSVRIVGGVEIAVTGDIWWRR
jgi:hypothetical protein